MNLKESDPELYQLKIGIESLEIPLTMINSVYPRLESALKEFEADLNHYEAIGIMEGTRFHQKVAEKKALLNRLKAVKNLIDVFNESKEDINLEGVFR